MKELKLYEQIWLQKVNQLINENLDNTHFNTQNLAFQLNLSKASFYRRIVKLTGTSPADYIKNKRLEEARKLLADSPDCSLQELAAKVGYTRKDYFAKIFLAETC